MTIARERKVQTNLKLAAGRILAVFVTRRGVDPESGETMRSVGGLAPSLSSPYHPNYGPRADTPRQPPPQDAHHKEPVMIAQRDTWTQEERDFLLAFADDTEESPWMVTTDVQQMAVDGFRFPLQHHAAKHHPEWYISTDLLVLFPKPDGTTGQVAPDVFVAVAPDHQRDSFNTMAEGGFPAFVLEVVSPDYSKRDEQEKARLYGMYGVEEYVIFNPRAIRKPKLQGYHRVAGGAWMPWPLEARGALRSAVLGLTLVADGLYLRLQDAEGHWILSKAEEAEQRAAAAEQRATAAEQRATAAEQQAAKETAQRKDLEALLAEAHAALARLQS